MDFFFSIGVRIISAEILSMLRLIIGTERMDNNSINNNIKCFVRPGVDKIEIKG